MPDQRARIDPINRDNVPTSQISIERFLRTPTGSHAARFAHRETLYPGPIRFFVFAVDAVVANQWVGHANDLAGVRRIREYFLVASHRSVEDHFTHTLAFRGPGATTENATIFKSENSWLIFF